MELNNDDTPLEQYANYMLSKIPGNIMLNCDLCCRLFFIPHKIALAKHNAKLALLCVRCRSKEIITGLQK